MQTTQLVERSRFKYTPAGEHLIEHQAQRENIALDRYLPALKLFRSHVGGSSGFQIFSRNLPRDGSQTEIGDADPARSVEHDIGRLEVPVEHTLPVTGGNAGTDLAGNVDRFVLGKPPDPPQQNPQILPVDEFHAQKGKPFEVADVVDPADVGVRHLPRQPDLGMKARKLDGIAGQLRGQELQGDGLVELQIVGSIDFSHPALSYESDDSIAIRKNRPRSESPLRSLREMGLGAGTALPRCRPRRRGPRFSRQARLRARDGRGGVQRGSTVGTKPTVIRNNPAAGITPHHLNEYSTRLTNGASETKMSNAKRFSRDTRGIAGDFR